MITESRDLTFLEEPESARFRGGNSVTQDKQQEDEKQTTTESTNEAKSKDKDDNTGSKVTRKRDLDDDGRSR